MFKRSAIARKINDFLDFCMENFAYPFLLGIAMILIYVAVSSIGYLFSKYLSSIASIITNILLFIFLFVSLLVVIFSIIGLLRLIYLKIKGDI